jgi:hypothetical protein
MESPVRRGGGMSKSFKLVSKCVQKIEKYLLSVNKVHKPIILANPTTHTKHF